MPWNINSQREIQEKVAKSWILPFEWCYERAGVGGMSVVTIQAPKFLSGSMAKLWLPNGWSNHSLILVAWDIARVTYRAHWLAGFVRGSHLDSSIWTTVPSPRWGRPSMRSALVTSRGVYTIMAFGVVPPGLPELLSGYGSFRKLLHSPLPLQDYLGRLGYPGLSEESSGVWDIVDGSPSGPCCSPDSPWMREVPVTNWAEGVA